MRNYENLIIIKNEPIVTIKINRPKVLNALNTEVLEDLENAFLEIERDDEIKGVIVTGEGRSFVAGADIAQMLKLSTEEGRAMTIKGQKVMELIENINKPVIAAVNGFALGGGCELAMACDIRIASEKAKFGQPEVSLGIIPGYGGTQRLPRIVGSGMAKHLIYSGEMIDAEEAFRIGLVQKVYPLDNFLDDVIQYLKAILKQSPIAVRMAKIAINKGLNMDLNLGVSFEAEAYVSTFGSDDRKEGMEAFVQKREPDFYKK